MQLARLFWLGSAVALLACGDAGDDTTGPRDDEEPEFPDVAGTYAMQGSFEVTCSSTITTGTIRVTTVTMGNADLEPDGYTVALDGGAPQRITDNTPVTFSDVSAGSHTLALGDIYELCTVEGDNPRTVNVPAGETVEVQFTVRCEANTGSVSVTTTTTDEDPDPDGYSVTLEGYGSQDVTDASEAFYDDVFAGEYDVTLSGIAENCTTTNNPRTITVDDGETTHVNFQVTCSAVSSP